MNIFCGFLRPGMNAVLAPKFKDPLHTPPSPSPTPTSKSKHSKWPPLPSSERPPNSPLPFTSFSSLSKALPLQPVYTKRASRYLLEKFISFFLFTSFPAINIVLLITTPSSQIVIHLALFFSHQNGYYQVTPKNRSISRSALQGVIRLSWKLVILWPQGPASSCSSDPLETSLHHYVPFLITLIAFDNIVVSFFSFSGLCSDRLSI
jgi:hypothetical protein